MSRRIIGIIAALLLALLGTVVLVAYVSNAEERALAGEELVEVYVITAPIPSGTAAEDLEELVSVEEVPAKVRADGAVESLPSLAGLVAAVDLIPGEQLVSTRFVERNEVSTRGVGIDVPEDLVEITVAVHPQRAVGGLVQPGQTVAVFASFEGIESEELSIVTIDGEQVAVPGVIANALDGGRPAETDTLLRKILVTAVQEGSSGGGFGSDDDANRLDTAPADDVFVTLAVTPFDAERLVFAMEFGRIWVAIEQETVPETIDPPQDRDSVFLREARIQ